MAISYLFQWDAGSPVGGLAAFEAFFSTMPADSNPVSLDKRTPVEAYSQGIEKLKAAT